MTFDPCQQLPLDLPDPRDIRAAHPHAAQHVAHPAVGRTWRHRAPRFLSLGPPAGAARSDGCDVQAATFPRQRQSAPPAARLPPLAAPAFLAAAAAIALPGLWLIARHLAHGPKPHTRLHPQIVAEPASAFILLAAFGILLLSRGRPAPRAQTPQS